MAQWGKAQLCRVWFGRARPGQALLSIAWFGVALFGAARQGLFSAFTLGGAGRGLALPGGAVIGRAMLGVAGRG